MQELIAAYDEYISFLEGSERDLLVAAYVRGYRTSMDMIEKGERLRVRIETLKKEVGK